MTKEDLKTGNHYQHSWEPRVAKLIVERLQKEAHADSTPVDDPALIRSDDGTEGPSHSKPFLVALVGIPGGGKSVSSLLLATLLEEQGIPTMIMPHDGYHLPMDQLRQFPESQDMIYRRGAPDTFDPVALKRDLDRIRNNTMAEEGLIMVPGFDHARGDPEPGAHAFDRNFHKVVIGEGLYLLHDSDGWEGISSFFDLKVFIDSNIDNCMERLKIRNLAIPGYTPEEIVVRVDAVDRKNAQTVLATKGRADLVVESIVAKPDTDELQSHHSGMGRHTRVPSMEALNLIVTTMDMNGGGGAGASSGVFDEPYQPHHRHQRSMTLTDYDFSNDPLMMDEPLPPMAPLIGTWEKEMAQQILAKMKEKPDQRPFMVGLVGMPGSGKSASVFLLANELEQQGVMSMTMPHDGYHYTLDYLRSFVNAEDAIYRRGAPDTFDPSALYRDLDRIRNNTNGEDLIKVPGFDHANGDPEPDQHIFDRNHHDVVICEGLYLLHDADGWSNIKDLLDFSIFMDSDVDVCIERVKYRNQCIPGYTIEEIIERAEVVDRHNANLVLHSKYRADVVVESTATKK